MSTRHLLPVTVLLAACNSGSSAAPEQRAANPADQSQPTQVTDILPFDVRRMAQFDQPFALKFLPDGTALVTEKTGHLKLWRQGASAIDVAGVPPVAQVEQGGLLDIALAPDFASGRRLYLTWSEPRAGGSDLALGRATLGLGAAPALTDFHVLWRSGSEGEGGQFGAIIAFAPDGKSLFLSSGERQRFTPAQDPNQALGKILHLTLDGKPAPDNPNAGKTGPSTVAVIDPPRDTEEAKTARGRPIAAPSPNLAPADTWTSGHRNPYGLVFTPDGRLWEHEMGPRGGDELNLILRGRNYGWPVVSNGINYDGKPIPAHASHPEFEAPKLWWVPSVSPSGMIYYSGDVFPQWKGSLLLGALSGQSLIRVTLNGDKASKAEQWKMGMRIRDVAQSPDGNIWLLADGGSDGWLMELSPKK